MGSYLLPSKSIFYLVNVSKTLSQFDKFNFLYNYSQGVMSFAPFAFKAFCA